MNLPRDLAPAIQLVFSHGAIVLLDRHYNSLKPYRKGDLARKIREDAARGRI